MENQYPKPAQDYKVVIRCHTYNQEAYIRDALNGFVRQKTNFPFCALVIDDCSTDHNADIIREYERKYPDVIKGVYLKENYYSQKKSKDPIAKPWIERTQYISYCEGDDFWIDDYKLQRQVDFLDAHPGYMMHFHNALVRYQNHDKPDHLMSYFETGDFNTALLFEKWQLPLASVLFRKEILKSQVYQDLIKVYPGGFCLFIASSREGKVYGLSECLSVYRKNDGGISNGFTAAYAMGLNYGFAKASGDPGALKVMDRKAARELTGRILPYFRRQQEAIEMVKVVDSFNRSVFYRALWKYTLSLPIRIMKKLHSRKGITFEKGCHVRVWGGVYSLLVY